MINELKFTDENDKPVRVQVARCEDGGIELYYHPEDGDSAFDVIVSVKAAAAFRNLLNNPLFKLSEIDL
jgi:hypothetical protein